MLFHSLHKKIYERFPRLRFLLTYVDNFGIGFFRKGDEIIWLWPWRRSAISGRYISLCLDSVFSSLAEIDAFWEGAEKLAATLRSINCDAPSTTSGDFTTVNKYCE